MVLEHTAADIRHLREALAADETWSVSSSVGGCPLSRARVRNVLRGLVDLCETNAERAVDERYPLMPVDDVLNALRRGLES